MFLSVRCQGSRPNGTPDGRELVLYQRGDTFLIQIEGDDLMASRAHGSEEEMARIAS